MKERVPLKPTKELSKVVAMVYNYISIMGGNPSVISLFPKHVKLLESYGYIDKGRLQGFGCAAEITTTEGN